MQFRSALLFAIPLLSVNAQTPKRKCSKQTGGVHVIAVPGEGSADPPYGLIGSLATSIKNAIPGSNSVYVPYNHSETNGVVQTQAAGSTLATYIQQYNDACPLTKIVLLGYSSGGISTMNVMCGTTSPPYNPSMPGLDKTKYGAIVVATVVYGEETRNNSPRKYNAGTCKGQGIHPRPNPQGCVTWRDYIKSYCDKEDPECCATTGTDMEAHYGYPDKYDQIATQFVVDRVNAFGGP